MNQKLSTGKFAALHGEQESLAGKFPALHGKADVLAGIFPVLHGEQENLAGNFLENITEKFLLHLPPAEETTADKFTKD